MTTSGSIDFVVNRDDIITEALELLGVLGEGQSPTANQLTSCAMTLNMMVKYWQSQGLNIYALANQTVDLVADTASYTLNPRPMAISNALRRDANGNDIPLDILTRNDYLALTDKDSSGAPVSIYYDHQVGTDNKMYIWPVPSNTDYDIIVYYQRTLEDFDAAADDADFPQEWYLPLAYNLATLLAPKYGVPAGKMDRIAAMAKTMKEEVESFDRDDYIQFTPERDW